MKLKLCSLAFFAVLLAALPLFTDEPPMFTLHQVGPGVFAAIDIPQSRAGSNSGFIIGEDGVAVVDTFESADAARALLGEIRKQTKLPVRYVVNTHYHLDHVAGNGVFAEAGATIFAQRNVRDWIHTENLKFFRNLQPEQKKLVEGLVAPQVVYNADGVDLFLGARRISVRVLPGHTGGDSVVYVPDAHVVFCGDLFWRHTLPNLIDASTAVWIESDGKLLAAGPQAVFVPGHGEVGNAADVAAFRDYLIFLRQSVQPAVAQSKSGDELVNSVLPVLKAKYGDWDFFPFFSRSNILQTADELAGKKKVPQESPEWFEFSAR
ncbi:MAG: MBL fold metallo-hydrolase [Candidatus Acidiferrales bacterium]